MTAIIDHVAFKVVDFPRSRDFYTAALGALGIKLLAEFEYEGVKSAGYGDERPTFWLGTGKSSVAATRMSPSPPRVVPPSKPSTPWRSPPAAATTARRACASTIRRITTPHSCSIRMGTMSRPSMSAQREDANERA